MKRTLPLLSLVFAALYLLSLPSCTQDVVEDYYQGIDTSGGSSGCDTTAVSYINDIQPVFQQNCYFCHDATNAATAGAGINLDGYARTKSWVDNGRLVGAVAHDPGFSPMPKFSARLDSCFVDQLRAWANAGAPDN